MVLLVLWTAACDPDREGPVAGDEFEGMRADQVLFDVRHYMSRDGVRQALLLADTAFVHESNGLVELRGVNLRLFSENGAQRATLTSREGTLNSQTQAMDARGSAVLVTRDNQRRIETESLHFDPEQDRIWSDVATTMYEGESVVYGDGFTSDGQLLNVKVTRPRGRFEGVEIEF